MRADTVIFEMRKKLTDMQAHVEVRYEMYAELLGSLYVFNDNESEKIDTKPLESRVRYLEGQKNALESVNKMLDELEKSIPSGGDEDGDAV